MFTHDCAHSHRSEAKIRTVSYVKDPISRFQTSFFSALALAVVVGWKDRGHGTEFLAAEHELPRKSTFPLTTLTHPLFRAIRVLTVNNQRVCRCYDDHHQHQQTLQTHSNNDREREPVRRRMTDGEIPLVFWSNSGIVFFCTSRNRFCSNFTNRNTIPRLRKHSTDREP